MHGKYVHKMRRNAPFATIRANIYLEDAEKKTVSQFSEVKQQSVYMLLITLELNQQIRSWRWQTVTAPLPPTSSQEDQLNSKMPSQHGLDCNLPGHIQRNWLLCV